MNGFLLYLTLVLSTLAFSDTIPRLLNDKTNSRILLDSQLQPKSQCEFACQYNDQQQISTLSKCESDGKKTTLQFKGNSNCDFVDILPDLTKTSDVIDPCCTGSDNTNESNDQKGLIVGGFIVTANQYPFIALPTKNGYGWCTGSILRKSYPALILTAAHCYKNTPIGSGDTVRLLANSLNNYLIEIPVWKQALHPQYNAVSGNENYDVAILYLDTDLTQYSQLQEVEIAAPPTATNTWLLSIGYGADFSGGPPTKTLEAVWLNKVECQSNDAFRDNRVCAGMIEGEGPCSGDSGGPLIIPNTNKQIGVLSGASCGRSGFQYWAYWQRTTATNIYSWIMQHKKLQCVFPFKFGNQNYYSCTTDGRSDGRLWCGTDSEYSSNGDWRYCTHNGESNGTPCSFPFYFSGTWYDGCTIDGRSDGKLWCSVDSSYKGNWNFCE